ncbi:MAG: leucine-rich repeat domain-containing protein, partial [Ruminiclostridium sp.]|nr:leucine-rich repeat domain-containing protein [Ruminiclostridium sp.]
PNNVDAYIGKAEAYIAMGDTANAIKTLQTGYDKTGDERIKAKLDELTAPAETTAETTTAETTTTTEATTTTTEETTAEPEEQIEYIDAEPEEIENMLLAYIRGEGELRPEMLGKVEKLEILGEDFVSVDSLSIYERLNYYSFTPNWASNIYALHYEDGYIYKCNYGDITDLSFVNEMPALTSLSIECNHISDLSPLTGMNNLTSLSLDYNQISDLSPLTGMVNLTSLSLSDKISDISPLSGLKNLKILALDFNDISDISPLSGLTNLEWLWLNYNYISDISPLSDLTNLERLSLGENNISDISPLNGLAKLIYCDFGLVDKSGTSLSREYYNLNYLSQSDIESFKAAHPDCEVIVSYE